MAQVRNAYALGGLLNSLQLAISPAQLRALPNSPLTLIGSPGPGLATLIRSIVASLTFGTTPFVAAPGSLAALFYGGPSRFGIAGGASPQGPGGPFVVPATDGPYVGFKIVSVAAAVGGATTYSISSSNLAANSLIGLPASPSGCTNAANNASAPGGWTVTANTATTITISNPSGVLESSPPAAANMSIGAPISLIGGLGSTIDLTPLLTTATGSAVQAWSVAGWQFPRGEIENAPIFLGTFAWAGLVAPQNFSAGDSSLVLTVEYLQIQL
jgi:hypothetical protein